MKLVPFAMAAALILTVFPATLQAASPLRLVVTPSDIEHSGGCRKSSPVGQCCHAGSQPYHCH